MAARLTTLTLLIGTGLLLIGPQTTRAEKRSSKSHARKVAKGGETIELKKRFKSKPLENKMDIAFSHAPFLQAECGICHVSNNPKKPGKLRAPTNKICLSCHEPTARNMKGNAFRHKPVVEDCGYCHNAHNSKYRYLLYESPRRLCTGCHKDIANILRNAKVKHDPTYKGRTCGNCHEAHSAQVEHLLRGLPSSMCLTCHSKGNIIDEDGKKLINIGRLLKDNKIHHEPVDKKDCSACHAVHGSDNFRVLIKPYPMEFYAVYSKQTYALCYTCHNKDEAITEAETTTLTAFRDGNRNLHTVHVVAPERGRTCRACHGEHATKQNHLIREEVPFGSQGWMLKINYRATPTGGLCAKTCHDTKEYKNR